ncbi:MAG: hypothetical protein ACREQP_01665, partial [Candidatus Binatia bacterium]
MIEKDSATIHRYDTPEFPFHSLVDQHFRNRLQVGSENLHTVEDPALLPPGVVQPGEDNNTPLHEILYTIFRDDAFLPLYRKFVHRLQAVIGEELVFQKKPTFRIHLPGNLSVGNYHRDRDYGHPPEEINVWVPVTEARKTATIWLESE